MPKTILIVDDEETICAAIRDYLEMKEYKVLVAYNGVQGLKNCSENDIDLIILDLNMPRMDGYMFMEHLKQRWDEENRRTRFPYVLVLTAVDKKTDYGLAENLGASKFMNKPFKSKELLKEVEALIGS